MTKAKDFNYRAAYFFIATKHKQGGNKCYVVGYVDFFKVNRGVLVDEVTGCSYYRVVKSPKIHGLQVYFYSPMDIDYGYHYVKELELLDGKTFSSCVKRCSALFLYDYRRRPTLMELKRYMLKRDDIPDRLRTILSGDNATSKLLRYAKKNILLCRLKKYEFNEEMRVQRVRCKKERKMNYQSLPYGAKKGILRELNNMQVWNEFGKGRITIDVFVLE